MKKFKIIGKLTCFDCGSDSGLYEVHAVILGRHMMCNECINKYDDNEIGDEDEEDELDVSVDSTASHIMNRGE
jgi:hypothetical protein